MSMKRLIPLLLLLLILPALACDALSSGGNDSSTPEPAATDQIIRDTPAATDEPAATATTEATATAEPTATVDAAAGFTTYTSETVGVTVSYPADWEIMDFIFLALAPSPELLENTAGISAGTILAIVAEDSSEFPEGTPAEVLEASLTELGMEGATITEGPTPTEIQGQPAVIAQIEATADDGTSLVGTMAAIENSGRTALAFGFTPVAGSEQYLPVIQAIMNTIEVGEPSGEDPFGGLGDVTPAPPVETIPLATGEFLSGSFADGAASDFSVQGTAGVTLTIVVSPTSDFDVVVEVFDPSNLESSLLRVDDGAFGDPEVAQITPGADGEYIVRVTNWSFGAGDFDVIVFDVDQALAITGQITGEEVRSARICVPAGERLVVVVQPAEEIDAVLQLTDAEGSPLTSTIDAGLYGEVEVAIYSTAVGEADYPIIIEVSDYFAQGGDYTLYLLPANAVEEGC